MVATVVVFLAARVERVRGNIVQAHELVKLEGPERLGLLAFDAADLQVEIRRPTHLHGGREPVCALGRSTFPSPRRRKPVRAPGRSTLRSRRRRNPPVLIRSSLATRTRPRPRTIHVAVTTSPQIPRAHRRSSLATRLRPRPRMVHVVATASPQSARAHRRRLLGGALTSTLSRRHSLVRLRVARSPWSVEISTS